ncbi:hypothetical protein AVEN_216547-1 [Araneus ventricosus]|uniref:Uncharacterized protein n=1 Tax=Araneus ventricosus TaxID=182803 RepID=A0A4Y2EXU6_ARAVE|nr:hypothetical protein AVEN_216547-1 [Araneus ventricosus]
MANANGLTILPRPAASENGEDSEVSIDDNDSTNPPPVAILAVSSVVVFYGAPAELCFKRYVLSLFNSNVSRNVVHHVFIRTEVFLDIFT